ncbi:hypothetical protein A2115_03095 [Candidatus Woesebacteria bacterium GWA1_41_8]|uniref:PglD N-terminal domain-containing protein n=1 Tax=Candidatus Woesebacteria bacterium GWA1_41_8 TaxID=1802471 RepID=A0A1F7WHZ7_9BACT|nr:MAG: hypothetical protein A2115_03095 [Candidatus Woesebacteria bacterium GWA1_41_8]
MVERQTQTKQVVIFGTGKFARYAISCFERDSGGQLEVAALTVTDDSIEKPRMWGKLVTPFEDLEKTFPPDRYVMFVAVGPARKDGKLNGLRAHFYSQCKEKGYKLISYVHPRAEMGAETILGDNVFIPALNNIDHFVHIGNNVIFWAKNHIGHETVVGPDVFFSTGVTVSGSCKIGPNCYFGVNSCTADGIVVGSNSFIGMGVPITKDTEPGSVYKPAAIEPKDYKTPEMRRFESST